MSMNQLARVLVAVGLVACVTADAFADLKFSIKDDPADLTGTAPAIAPASASAPQGYNFTVPVQAGSSIVPLLKCPLDAHPCAMSYPSQTLYTVDQADYLVGRKQVPAGDTLMLMDACGRGRLPPCITGAINTIARIEKSDTEIDKVQIKGLEITALDDIPRSITISVDTGENNFAAPSGTGSRNFPITLYFGGSVTQERPETTVLTNSSCRFTPLVAADPAAARACPASRLTVTTNGTAHTGFMQVTTPCDPNAVPGSVAVTPPCGPGDKYLQGGIFSASRNDAITCDGECSPRHLAVVSTIFNKRGQSLLLQNSGVAAISRIEVERFGVEALSYSVADEFDEPFWVAFTAVDAFHRAEFFPPADPTADMLRFAFRIERTTPMQFQGGDLFLNSIATLKQEDPNGMGDAGLPVRERARNDRSYASFIAQPQTLRWKDVGSLRMQYEVTVGDNVSHDDRLDPMTFSDCSGSSLYVRVTLTDDQRKNAGDLLIRLGDSDDASKKCVTVHDDNSITTMLNGVDLVKEDHKRRVDVSQITKKKNDCCKTLKETQEKYGRLFVRSISLVVDQGSNKKAHRQVVLHGGEINGIDLTKSLVVPDPAGWGPFTELSKKGTSIRISDANALPAVPFLVLDQVEIDGPFVAANVGKEELHGVTAVRVDLCLFGGTCIAQGIFPTQ
jgi:hypothetical protein